MFQRLFLRFLTAISILVAFSISSDHVSASSSSATNVVATASTTTSGAVDVSWTNATVTPQPTGYLIVPLKNDIEVSSLVVQVARNGLSQTTRTVTGLTDGTSYTFRIDAVYLSGSPVQSAPSASATPYDVPAVPTIAASAGNGKVTLSWTAVDNKGSSVSAYVVAVTPAPATNPGEVSGTATTTEVTGLANGTKYSFTLKARNLRGESAASAPVSSTPVGPPSTMLAPTATAGDENATVSWTAPTDSGGSDISSYTVTGTSSTSGAASPVAKTVTVANLSGVLSTQVTGLTNSKVYTFTVTATNGGNQTSASSPPSLSVTPSSAPPAAVSAVNPRFSALTGGESIAFSGSNLTGSTITATCSDASTPAVPAPTVTATLVTVLSPVCPAGPAQLTLSNGGNAVKIHEVTYLAAPTITSISPDSVTSTGASTITLTGTGFSTGNSSETILRVGGTLVTPTSVSATNVTFVAPILINGAALGTRTVQIILGSASGTLSASTSLTYTSTTNPVTFSDVSSKRFGSSPFSVAATTAAGNITYSSNTPSICTVSGATVTIIAAGTCRVSATTAGNTIYSAGTSEKVIIVERGSQTLTISPVPSLSVGATSSISVTNSAGTSGGLNLYQSSTPSVCSVSATGRVLGLASGDCVVMVTSVETDNYSSASASTTFAIIGSGSTNQPTTSDDSNSSLPTSNTPTPVASPSLSSGGGTGVSLAPVSATLKKGKTMSARSIAANVGTSISAGSKVVISVAPSSKSVCSVASANSGIRGVKAGSCKITLKITPKATAKVKKPKTVTKSLTIKVS
jgi:hypothetical protein